METAATVIKSALQEIVVQASEAPIEADEAQTAILYMNRLMGRLAATGLNLGYTKVSNLGDPITIPDGAIDGLVFNLALSLAPQYGAVVPPDLRINASNGLEAMEFLGVNVGPSSYGGTLPVGSGNEGDSVWDNDHFYPDPNEPILTENYAYISLEDGTET